MNYEELLESRNGAAMAKQALPFGWMHKQMADGKYVNVVDLKDDLKDSLVFTDALAAEADQNKHLNHRGQIHFEPQRDSAGLYGVTIDQGSYTTFSRLLEDHPAVVAQDQYVVNTIKALLEMATYLHGQGVYHLCFAPDNVLARKNDNVPMLLFHGSAYRTIRNLRELYGDSAAFIAPEVLDGGKFDERSDVFSIGKFMEYLYKQSNIPLELKGVIAKATDANPEQRYLSADEMLKAINSRQSTRSSVVMGGAALLVVLICFGLYFSLVPDREDIEFVKPAPKEAEEDFLDDGFDPVTELGLVVDSSASQIDEKKLREYEAKAEQIFRKNFTREANRILSGIYSDDRMRNNEKNFLAGSHSTMEELVKAQTKLGNDAGLAETRSKVIASEIIDQVTNRLKKQMEEKEKSQD